ncbi:MAG: aspartate carbamoyltransferase regulatory subunit [Eubacteriales bacterium]|nr:aspartate carbamoyltransferase regulatory subunit [Clostridiales bacterium]MDY5836638.1 aspartate carbamoyltransferase regulatory subunit [Eubacteriales bacterium]
MIIGSIHDGLVIDHIPAGKAMEIYEYLDLDQLDCQVAIIKNAESAKRGRKDILKINEIIDLDYDLLGYIDPHITVNVIRDGQRVKKFHPALPEKLVGVLKCKNPRCISSIEQELPQIFQLTDRDQGIYRCIYCDTKAEDKN